MTLYEFGPTRALRARWVLQELGVPFDAVSVNLGAAEHTTPEFLKLNPAAKIPVLVDGDFVLTESVAIALYLAEKHPEGRLLPTTVRERAETYRWLFFTATELEQPLWRIARHTFVYPEEERIEADVIIARREFEEMAAVLEEHMQGRQFVVGAHATVADFIAAYTLDWASEEELLARFPTLTAYMERMYTRPQAPPRIAEAAAKAGSGG